MRSAAARSIGNGTELSASVDGGDTARNAKTRRRRNRQCTLHVHVNSIVKMENQSKNSKKQSIERAEMVNKRRFLGIVTKKRCRQS